MLFRMLEEIVLPPICPLCRSDLAEDGGLCGSCGKTMPLLPERRCRGCGGPNPSVLALCPDCQKARGGRPWRLAATAFPYFGGARTAVRLFKYHGRLSLAPYLGRRMAAAWLEQGGDVSVDVVSYVPLFFTRYLQRGYNQAAVLADFVGRELGLPVLRTLLRRRRTPRQAGLNRAGRLRNLRGAFLPWRANRWAGRSVLLVDDVFTTGSTLHEAATTLLAGGAAEISVLTAARD